MNSHASDAPLAPDQVLASGTDRYAITQALGEGGFGLTSLGYRVSDQMPVVIKRLRMERVSQWKAVELFEREAKVLAELDHPNIPKYVDFFEAEEAGFVLVQQYIQGPTLGQMMSQVARTGKPLDPQVMQRVLFRMLQTLAYLHALSPPVIHRDITPKNIILTPQNVPYLIDFGTVQAALLSDTAISSTSAGTFGYAPMEQFIGRATPSSDLYALAMTFVATITGAQPERLPFQNNRLQVNQALGAQAPSYDARLRLALEAMVHPDASHRPQSAAEVLALLGHQAPDGMTSAPPQQQAAPPKPSDASAPWRRSHALQKNLGPRAIWGAPPIMSVDQIHGAHTSPDGRWIVVLAQQGIDIIDALTMTSKYISLPGRHWGIPKVSFGSRGPSVLIVEPGLQTCLMVSLLDATWRALQLMQITEVKAVALSPDEQMIALVYDDKPAVTLLSASDGRLIRHLPVATGAGQPYEPESVHFSPDGALLVASGYEGSLLFDTQGRSCFHPFRRFAMSANGQNALVVYDEERGGESVHWLEQLEPDAFMRPTRRLGRRLPVDVQGVLQVAISPDGSWGALVAHERDEIRMLVLHPAQTEGVTWDAGQPYSDAGLSYPVSFGITADHRVVLHMTELLLSPLNLGVTAMSAIIGSLPQGRWLGHLLALARDEEYDAQQRNIQQGGLVFGANVLINGQVLGDDTKEMDQFATEVMPALRVPMDPTKLSDHQYAEARKQGVMLQFDRHRMLFGTTFTGLMGALDPTATLGALDGPIMPWERPDAVRASLLGRPLDGMLSPQDVALYQDMQLRLGTLHQACRDGALSNDESFGELMIMTRSVNAFLPYLFDQARKLAASSATARFGPALGPDQLCVTPADLIRAAQELAARDEAAKDAIFERMCADLDRPAAKPGAQAALGGHHVQAQNPTSQALSAQGSGVHEPVLPPGSAHWRHTYELTQRAGAKALWDLPEQDDGDSRIEGMGFSDDGTRMIVTTGEGVGWLIDPMQMEAVARFSTPDRCSGVVFAPGGQHVLVHGDSFGAPEVYRLGAKMERVGLGLQIERVQNAALSPDGQLVASCESWTSKAVEVFQTATGAKSGEVSLQGERADRDMKMQFSPDGQVLLISSERGTLVARGSQVPVSYPLTRVAFGPGGTCACVVKEERDVWLWGPQEIARLGEAQSPRGQKLGFASEGRIKEVAIGPDGTRAALYCRHRQEGDDLHEVVVLDLTQGGAVSWRATTSWVGAPLGEIEALAFAKDGRLFVHARAHDNPYDMSDQNDLIMVASTTGQWLGVLAGKESLFAKTPQGFWGMLDGRPPSPSPWHRVDVARSALLGAPISGLLGEQWPFAKEAAGRLRALQHACSDGIVMQNADLHELMTQVKPVAFLLPLAIEQAVQAQSGAASFGQVTSVPSAPAGAVAEAARRLAERDPQQQHALFEQMCARLDEEARQREEQERAVEAQEERRQDKLLRSAKRHEAVHNTKRIVAAAAAPFCWGPALLVAAYFLDLLPQSLELDEGLWIVVTVAIFGAIFSGSLLSYALTGKWPESSGD